MIHHWGFYYANAFWDIRWWDDFPHAAWKAKWHSEFLEIWPFKAEHGKGVRVSTQEKRSSFLSMWYFRNIICVTSNAEKYGKSFQCSGWENGKWPTNNFVLYLKAQRHDNCQYTDMFEWQFAIIVLKSIPPYKKCRAWVREALIMYMILHRKVVKKCNCIMISVITAKS